MKICILIPAHNESRTIGSLVLELKNRKLDVLVIDDGSTDRSGDIAEEAGAKVIRNEPKGGKGYSLKKGFNYALSNGYEGVIMMDGDGQHHVDDIENFILMARKQPVCVINGNRMANAKGMPLVRYLTNRFMSFLVSSVCGQNIADTQCGYRYAHAKILKDFNFISDDFEIETEMLMKAAKKKYKIFSVPIRTIYEDEKSKIHPVKDTVRFIRYFTKEIFSSK